MSVSLAWEAAWVPPNAARPTPTPGQDPSTVPASNRSHLLAAGGLAGPAAFVGAWVTGGALLDNYSPAVDAISRLAAVDADTRWLMTGGFLGFTAASIPAAAAVRQAIPGRAWTGVLGTGLATSVVAALPLDRNDTIDSAHAVTAGVGYALFIYAAAASVSPLRADGRSRLATFSAAVAAVSTATLVATPFVEFSGLLQRIGLTSLDVWLVTISSLILRDRLRPSHRSVS